MKRRNGFIFLTAALLTATYQNCSGGFASKDSYGSDGTKTQTSLAPLLTANPPSQSGQQTATGISQMAISPSINRDIAASAVQDYFIGESTCELPTHSEADDQQGNINSGECTVELHWNDSPNHLPRRIFRIGHTDFAREVIDTTYAGSIKLKLDINQQSVKLESLVGTAQNPNPTTQYENPNQYHVKEVATRCRPNAAKTANGVCLPLGSPSVGVCKGSEIINWAGTSASTVEIDNQVKWLLCSGETPQGDKSVGSEVSIQGVLSGTINSEHWYMGFGHARVICKYDDAGRPRWVVDNYSGATLCKQ